MTSSFQSWCEEHLHKVRIAGGWAEARCPLHDDHKPSLRVDIESGGYKCNSGSCPHPTGHLHQLAERAGLSKVGLPERERPGKGSNLEQKAEYHYPMPDGQPFGLVRRLWDSSIADKTFRQLSWRGGKWVFGREGKFFPIYRAPHIAAAPASSIVLWLEGEKCVDQAVELGFEATTSAGGAQGFGKCDKASLHLLVGRRVYVLPDNDKPGQAYARQVATALVGIAAEVHLVDLPGLSEKGDLVDWVQAGGTAEALQSILSASTPGLDLPGLTNHTNCHESPTNHDEYRTNHGRNRTEEDDEEDEEPFVDKWPTLHPAALHGLAGRFLRLIEPCSETDPIALLMTFLTCVGHSATSRPHFVTEADRQTGSLYICLVGKSSRGRKGSSLGWIERLFSNMIELDPTREEILKMRDIRGLASGEGLIERMRDPEGPFERDYHRERLLVIETELAGILQRMNREGSILSPILRQGWDGKTIENPTKSNPAKVSHPHLSLIGHVTSHELSKLFGETEVFNGLGNRFLWTCVRRSKFLPVGRQPHDDDFREIADELGNVLVDAHRQQRLHFTAQAEALWQDVYQTLETEKPSPLVDALTARSAAQVIRLSLIYALLNRSRAIDLPHLRAGLAVWDYCEQSAHSLHPPAMKGDLDGKVIRALESAGGEGLTTTDLHKATGRNYKAEQITAVLRRLEACHVVSAERIERPGAVRGNFTARYFARKVPTIQQFIDSVAPGECIQDQYPQRTKLDLLPPVVPSFPTFNPPEFQDLPLEMSPPVRKKVPL